MKSILLSVFFAAAAYPLTLSINNPSVIGYQGGSVNFGFTAKADSSVFVTYVASFLVDESNSSIGSYVDNIGALGGPANFVHPPKSKDWTGVAGSYLIDPSAPIGASSNATLRVLYETYRNDPAKCTNCWLDSQRKDIAVSVTVVPVLEPGSVLLMSLAMLALILRRVAA